MSFYQGLGTREPSWVVEHGEPVRSQGSLHLRQGLGTDGIAVDGTAEVAGPASLTVTRDGRMGVAEEVPEWRLDVAGVARMQGRIGCPTEGLAWIPADGRWHDITRPMTGCQAFEVMAGAGGEPTRGRYSMLHAIAMNAYHPRNLILNWLFGRRRIRAQTAVYGSYADRLRLRWVATDAPHHFKLQLRSNASFGEGKAIRYYLTRLWFDSLMTGSRGGPARDGGDLL